MRQSFLSHPRFQLLFTLSFVIGAVFIVLTLTVSTWATFSHLTKTLPLSEFQRTILVDSANQTVFLGGMAAILVGIVFFALGLYLSSKFIGPLTRLERWLENHLSGQKQLPFKLRRGDELSDTARLLFKVLEKNKGKI